MSRVAIFVDGGYVDKIQQHEFNGVRISYKRLSEWIAKRIHPNVDILRTYYYHCLPYQSDPPTQQESERFGSAQNFIDALGRLPRFEVRLGRLARRGPDKNGQYSYEQKMVDTLLSIDLVRLSTKNNITHAAIVGSDSDFVPAIRMARDDGVSVWLFHGQRVHDTLRMIADERVELTQEIMNKVKWYD